jgi:hypothetical protein
MDYVSMGLQAISAMKGGAGSQSPNVSSTTAGSFSGQTIVFGNSNIPDWNPAVGGNGPAQAQAYWPARGPDSFVMGLTGLNTQTGFAAGNGIAVQNQATQPQFAALSSSWETLALVGALAVAATLILKG